MEIKNKENVLSSIDLSKSNVIVTGVSGQDGSYMVDYLLKNTDYNIIGGARRLSVSNHDNIKHLEETPRFHLINFDLNDPFCINDIILNFQPRFFINFAAQSFVKSSWEFPRQTWDTNTTGVLHILESIRTECPTCKIYNAGSSEEFGDVVYTPQDEKHPLRPRSPYGASKAAARHLVKVCRESYDIFAVQGWLFNHEGCRRGEEFVTRKISKKVAGIYNNIIKKNDFVPLELGNLDALRDWSDAEDFVEAVWLMLNNSTPREYVVASGESHSIREFVELAFENVGIKGRWEGSGVDETYVYVSGGFSPKPITTPLVIINPTLYRPAEVNQLCGDSSKIRNELGWSPKVSFRNLVKKMVNNDLYKIIKGNTPD